MTDNKITREKTFSEELPYFKERMKEISDNYDNPDGYADVLYLSALSDSNRIVRKAEEEINRQKAEYNNLLEQFRILDCECGRLEKADENQKAEIERLKIENQSLRGAANSYKLHYNEARNEAVKEFADRLQIRCIKQGGCLWSSDIGAELREMVGEDNS